MLIIQNSKKIHFEIIKKLKTLSSLTKNNRFYENNKLIEDNHLIKKGVHFIHFRSYIKGGSNNICIKISSTILTTSIGNEQNMFDLYRLVATWTCTNISSFSIQLEDFGGLRRVLSHNDIFHKGQFRMLIVKFIPIEQQNDLINTEPIHCDNMLRFELANEDEAIFKAITINGLLKIRTLKKILKYQFDKEGEWPIIDCLDEKIFKDYTQLNHFDVLLA
jgi:hypothetical protein